MKNRRKKRTSELKEFIRWIKIKRQYEKSLNIYLSSTSARISKIIDFSFLLTKLQSKRSENIGKNFEKGGHCSNSTKIDLFECNDSIPNRIQSITLKSDFFIKESDLEKPTIEIKSSDISSIKYEKD